MIRWLRDLWENWADFVDNLSPFRRDAGSAFVQRPVRRPGRRLRVNAVDRTGPDPKPVSSPVIINELDVNGRIIPFHGHPLEPHGRWRQLHPRSNGHGSAVGTRGLSRQVDFQG